MAEKSQWNEQIDTLKTQLITEGFAFYGDPNAEQRVADDLGIPLSTLVAEMKRLDLWDGETKEQDTSTSITSPSVAPTVSAPTFAPVVPPVSVPAGYELTSPVATPVMASSATTIHVPPRGSQRLRWYEMRKFNGPDGVRVCHWNVKGHINEHYWQLKDGAYTALRIAGLPAPRTSAKKKQAFLAHPEYMPTGKEPRVGCPLHHGYPEIAPDIGPLHLHIPTPAPVGTDKDDDRGIDERDDDHRGPDEETDPPPEAA
jgi:hypothetical protein